MIIIPTLNDNGSISYEEEFQITNANKEKNMTLILDKENPLATKVQTRDGRKARIICVDKVGGLPIIALVYNKHNYINDCFESSISYTLQGGYHNDSDSQFDLINVPEQKEEELLPCPFCGTVPLIHDYDELMTIICANPSCEVDCSIDDYSFNTIFEIWNTRTPLPNQSQWVKCSEELPKTRDYFLCFYNGIKVLFYDDIKKIFIDESDELDCHADPTHWMPLPLLPKDK